MLLTSEVQVSGTGTTRENIVSNELVMAPALQHLGVRPSVQTCMLHIKALYDLMSIPISGRLQEMVCLDMPLEGRH